MLRKPSVMLIAAALAALPALGAAQTSTSSSTTTNSSSSVPSNKLVEKYTSFAGSEGNAKALVTGLRNGSDITLTSGRGSSATTTTIDPPTKKMGYGNVNIALSLT